jgi:AraC family transcriptional regulator
VLSRRVEQAQPMLAETEMPIVEIALSVGFQAKSHFTTIFKRVIDQPPHAWRCEHSAARL